MDNFVIALHPLPINKWRAYCFAIEQYVLCSDRKYSSNWQLQWNLCIQDTLGLAWFFWSVMGTYQVS